MTTRVKSPAQVLLCRGCCCGKNTIEALALTLSDSLNLPPLGPHTQWSQVVANVNGEVYDEFRVVFSMM